MISEKSFKRNISVQDIFVGNQHREALARLEFVVEICGIFLLYGSPGSGKSTIIRAFISKLDPSNYCICYINNSALTPRDLYSSVLEAVSVISYQSLSRTKKQFSQVITDIFNTHKKRIVIFIDNAQAMSVQTISELRYMLNFDFDSMSPISLILIGQPELLPTLRLRVFEPLFYRINSMYHFRGLTQKQTSQYIMQQLELSGLSMLFPEDIIAKIQGHSKGLPQLINTICTSCLIDMKANSLNLVDNSVLERVLVDLQY